MNPVYKKIEYCFVSINFLKMYLNYIILYFNVFENIT